jgi:hypothetical protein
MPQRSPLLTNHSSYASQNTIPRRKLEALEGFTSNLKFRLAERSSNLIFDIFSWVLWATTGGDPKARHFEVKQELSLFLPLLKFHKEGQPV